MLGIRPEQKEKTGERGWEEREEKAGEEGKGGVKLTGGKGTQDRKEIGTIDH